MMTATSCHASLPIILIGCNPIHPNVSSHNGNVETLKFLQQQYLCSEYILDIVLKL